MKRPMIRHLSIALASVLFVACTGSAHSAIPPSYVSDQQLAKSPIIVVAKWEKVQRTGERDRDKPFVAQTKLRILRTVKGPKIDQEVIDLKLGWQISWGNDGEFLNSATSTNLLGYVEDVTVPCLWFLDRANVWEPQSPDHELSIDHYRKIQPLELEAYYLALETERAEQDIPQLLTADKSVLAKRVLQFIAGGQPIWPYSKSEGHIFRDAVEECKVLKSEAGRVWRIVGSDDQDLRRQAVAVYAYLTGMDGDLKLRTLLGDSNANVRGTALGILLHHQDAESLSRCDQAIQGIEDCYPLCAIINEISAWGNDQAVPALISCLQSGGSRDYYDDTFVPSLRARKVLHEITGCWFPPNVSKSMDAWRRVDSEKVKEKRYSALALLLSEKEFLLLAELVGQPIYSSEKPDNGRAEVRIQIRNTGLHELKITRNPCRISMNDPGSSLSIGTEDEGDIVTVGPDEAHEIQFERQQVQTRIRCFPERGC